MNQAIIAYDVLVDGGDITLDSTELVDYKIVKPNQKKLSLKLATSVMNVI